MMLGLQGNASKVYRCMACSATFTGLASLLVHQATHASPPSKVSSLPPTQPSISQNETVLASTDLSNELSDPQTGMPESPAPSFYICDCGEEFQDFALMLEHKQSHVPQIQLLQPPSNFVLPTDTDSPNVFPTQHTPFTSVTESSLVLSHPSTSKSSDVELTPVTAEKADRRPEDGIAIVTTPQGQCAPPQDDDDEKELENMSPTAEQISEVADDVNFQDETHSDCSSPKGENLPKGNNLMKLLASAYMKRFTPPEGENQNEMVCIPKQEIVPVDVTPAAKNQASPINDLSMAQLRRLLAKPGIKTKAPSISKILESSRKRVVSLTKTLSPVVVLETRQKLLDPSGNGTYGMFQCGRCRRVFQNVDKLTEHHFLHKKERIKCCRRCKQLIIGRLPLPESHVCPQLGGKAVQPLRSKFPFAQKVVPFHSLGNSKKVFFCPLCKNSYARRWNLKMHKCQGPRAAPSQQATPSIQKFFSLKAKDKSDINSPSSGSQNAKSVAVGTEMTGRIKVEVTSQSSEQSVVSPLAWTNPAKNFLPFTVKSSVAEEYKDSSLSGVSSNQEDKNSWDAKALGNDSNEEQWTMPLDDEMEMLSSADDKNARENSESSDQPQMAPNTLRYFVRDGVRRYPCNRCQKTYSRASTLRRHLRLCGFRPRGFGIVGQSASQGTITPNAPNVKPMFACSVCGRNFNRKDNMMVHRKRCQLQQAMGNAEQSGLSGNAAADPPSQTQRDDGGNWGIMSLPSVLPRRVTCECGAGFTSSKLLLEHMQKHAQESYTCPTCGETVNSWADYEVHLQIHMHPHHQLMKGIQPQRAQPVLLRFQQHQQQVNQPLKRQPPPVPLPSVTKKPTRIVCTRCGNTFASRCSLRRHISWNRCKGGRVANQLSNLPKSIHCSHCNSDFPNTISLIFHQRSGACKPAIKPVRCPVCLRWFGTVDSLQKHLLTHKHSESYRCDICQGTYPNLKSLKNHRRRIHRIMAGGIMPQTEQQLTS
ncbi:uncharacterized protein KZ484_025818 isoform 1-T2 [Pholidichthys leucotaenia]